MIHVAIAEDKGRIAAALRADLALVDNVRLVGDYRTGRAVVEGIQALDNLPDLIFMDIDMPELDGVEATRQIKARFPQIRILMLTVFEEEEHLFRAIRSGADGYLLKGATPEEMERAIQEALNGGAPLSPLMARKSLLFLRSSVAGGTEAAKGPEEVGPLSERETEVLQQLAAGLKYREVAKNLHLSEGTVRKHVENVYRKLRVNNKTMAVARGRDAGLIP